MALSGRCCFKFLTRPQFLQSRVPISNAVHLQKAPEEASPCSYERLLRLHPTPGCVEQVHAQIVVHGSSLDSFYATHLVKSYAKAKDYPSARRIFDPVPKKSVFLYNAIIRACSCNEGWAEIAELYAKMEAQGVKPDHYTLPFVIKAFSILRLVEEGKRVGDAVKRTGLIHNLHIATALIDMYLEFGEMSNARKLFEEIPERDPVAWTSMVSGYVRCGEHREAYSVFREMRLRGVEQDWVAVLSLIPVCDLSVHALVVRAGLNFYIELETALLNMYAKIGDVVSAHSLFSGMQERTLVSWGTMVTGYSQNGFGHEALTVFNQMLKTTLYKPDVIIATNIVQACALLSSLVCGEMVHGYLTRVGARRKLVVESGLINMYAKCGSVGAAERIFKEVGEKNMIVWSAMVAGYGYHGLGEKALHFFKQMTEEGFVPDEMAFLSILSACSHSGLVSEGKACFDMMTGTYNMVPNPKHYACMVDLLGRAGLVKEAWNFITEMPVQADVNTWGALLFACAFKGDVQIGELAQSKLLEIEPGNKDYSVVLGNLYASCGKWDEKSKIRFLMSDEKLTKVPGRSHIELGSYCHA